MISNRLTLNAKKTKFLIFGRKKGKYNQNFHVQINDEHVKQVPSAKFLGLTINERLSWKEHMMNLLSKIQRNLGFIYKIKKIFKPSVVTSIVLFDDFQSFEIWCCCVASWEFSNTKGASNCNEQIHEDHFLNGFSRKCKKNHG